MSLAKVDGLLKGQTKEKVQTLKHTHTHKAYIYDQPLYTEKKKKKKHFLLVLTLINNMQVYLNSPKGELAILKETDYTKNRIKIYNGNIKFI